MQLIDVYKVTVLISVLADIAPAFLYHWVIHGTQLLNHYHLFARLQQYVLLHRYNFRRAGQ